MVRRDEHMEDIKSSHILSYVPWSRLSRFFGDGKPPTFNRNPCNGYINPYYWVDDHPLLYGNTRSLDPGTYIHRIHIVRCNMGFPHVRK